jgi:Uma2 family endonuclease
MDPPPHIEDERRRLGLDQRDEMWEGVIHVVPPAAEYHQNFEGRLVAALLPLVDARGLRVSPEVGLYRADNDFRVPDITVYRPEVTSQRGVEGWADLVIEIVSPGDESRIKLPWYVENDSREILLIDRETLDLELYRPVEGEPQQFMPVHSVTLDCTFERVDERLLRVVSGSYSQDIPMWRPG